MLGEPSFRATCRLMLHFNNRGQLIHAARLSREAAIAQDSARQCLTKRVNVRLRREKRRGGGDAGRDSRRKPKTNVVPLGSASSPRRLTALRQAGQRACGGEIHEIT